MMTAVQNLGIVSHLSFTFWLLRATSQPMILLFLIALFGQWTTGQGMRNTGYLLLSVLQGLIRSPPTTDTFQFPALFQEDNILYFPHIRLLAQLKSRHSVTKSMSSRRFSLHYVLWMSLPPCTTNEKKKHMTSRYSRLHIKVRSLLGGQHVTTEYFEQILAIEDYMM